MFSQLFSGDILGKAAANPKTAPFTLQPDFVEKVKEIQRNPNSLSKHLGDQRLLTLLGMFNNTCGLLQTVIRCIDGDSD